MEWMVRKDNLLAKDLSVSIVVDHWSGELACWSSCNYLHKTLSIHRIPVYCIFNLFAESAVTLELILRQVWSVVEYHRLNGRQYVMQFLHKHLLLFGSFHYRLFMVYNKHTQAVAFFLKARRERCKRNHIRSVTKNDGSTRTTVSFEQFCNK